MDKNCEHCGKKIGRLRMILWGDDMYCSDKCMTNDIIESGEKLLKAIEEHLKRNKEDSELLEVLAKQIYIMWDERPRPVDKPTNKGKED